MPDPCVGSARVRGRDGAPLDLYRSRFISATFWVMVVILLHRSPMRNGDALHLYFSVMNWVTFSYRPVDGPGAEMCHYDKAPPHNFLYNAVVSLIAK